jgi:hypothetical protein
MYPARFQSPVVNEDSFRLVLLKEKSRSLLISGKMKADLLESLSRLDAKDVMAITERLEDIEYFIAEKYKEIENRANQIGRN